MLWVNTKRILRAGFVSFWRNAFVSVTAVLVMVITLFVIGSAVFTSAMLESSLTELRDKVDVNVYLLTTTEEEEALALKTSIEALPEVETVEYVSKEEALEKFKIRHEDDQLTLQALEELGENPLRAILNIKAKETSQYESIANFLDDESALSGVNESVIDKINYFQNKVAIDKLTRIIEASERLGFALTILLIILSVLITFNTIQLAIYSAREEISVMRLVGASNLYTRGPFVIEGMLYGMTAGIITLIVFYPVTLWLGPLTEKLFGSVNVFEYYLANFGSMFALIFFAGMLLGGLSSYLAVRKYLRV